MQYYVARCHIGLCCFISNHILLHWLSSSTHRIVLFCRLCPLMCLVFPRDGWNQSLDPSGRDGRLRSSARLQPPPGTGPFSSWLFSVHPPISVPARATESCFRGCLIQNNFGQNFSPTQPTCDIIWLCVPSKSKLFLAYSKHEWAVVLH